MTRQDWFEHSQNCFYCKVRFDNVNQNFVTADHIIPRSLLYEWNNFTVLSCWNCNQLKGNKFIEEFYKDICQRFSQIIIPDTDLRLRANAIKLRAYYYEISHSLKELNIILSYSINHINLNFESYESIFPNLERDRLLQSINRMKQEIQNSNTTITAVIERGNETASMGLHSSQSKTLSNKLRIHWYTTLNLYHPEHKKECFYQILTKIENVI